MPCFPRVLARPLAAIFLLAPIVGTAQPLRERPAAARAKTAGTNPLRTGSVPASSVAVDTSPWLFKGSDIPPDPEWHFGRLPNGLRYAVRRNGVPPGQVAVRVRIDAGSLEETDAQQGYAHFIEHLTFRGSKYVPDGEAKRTWQRFGATFGADSNASTTPTQTVYKLDLPGVTDAKLDESLRILSGMMAEPAITQTGMAAELPAVLAEQREAPGPQVRYGDAIRGAFFAGQPLADRSPIGIVKVLQASTPASVQAFHDAWYRPERAVVVISGDIDPQVAADLIVRNFASWKGVGANPADPDFGRPTKDEPATKALNEPSLPSVVALATLRPWQYRDDTIIFNQKRLVDFLALRLINRRLETRARAGGSFLQAAVSLDDVSRSANGTFTNIIPIGDDWEAAVKDVRAVIADAMATPPTQAEVDRELAEFDAAMKNEVDTARVEAGSKQADDMVQALDIRETVAGPKTSYDILQDARKKGFFTPAAIIEPTRRLFGDGVNRALVNTRVADAGAAQKLAAALSADVSKLAGKRVEQAAVDFSRVPKLGKPGKVTARRTVGDPAMEEVTFANGVRALIYANSSETGRVYLRVRFGRGYLALPSDKPTAAWAGDGALVASGIGTLDQGDLDQLTNGRRFGLDFDIADDAFVFQGTTTPADFSDNLALMAAKLAAPRWDPNPVARIKAATLAGYPALTASPDAVISTNLERYLRDGDPRWGVPTRPTVEALTPVSFRALWEPLLATGPIEVDVFGDVTAQAAIDAVAKSFGALKPRQPAPVSTAPIRFPQHNATPVMLTHDGDATQAAALIAWPTSGGSAAHAEQRGLEVLAAVFADRLFDRLRSAAGASYSPQAASQWPVGLSSGGRLVAIGQVAPGNVDLFFRLSRQIAAELVSTPLGADELKRTMVPMLQYMARASSGNSFWLNQLSGATYDPARLEGSQSIVSDMTGITPATLQALAARYLRPDRDFTMAAVPAAHAK